MGQGHLVLFNGMNPTVHVGFAYTKAFRDGAHRSPLAPHQHNEAEESVDFVRSWVCHDRAPLALAASRRVRPIATRLSAPTAYQQAASNGALLPIAKAAGPEYLLQ
jgi:hypothetical protein